MPSDTMKRRTVLKRFGIISASAIGSVGADLRNSEASQQLAIRTAPMVEAHRGFSEDAPENTLASFEKAIQAGADRIELDLYASKDGRAIVIHDPTLDRTTNGSGPVKELTLSELKRLDAGSWKHERYADQKIPAFKEVLELAKGRVMVDIDLKDTDAIEPMVEDLRSLDMVLETIVTGTSQDDIRLIRKVEPALSVFFERSDELNQLHEMGKKSEFIRTSIRLAQESQAPGFNFDYNTLSPEFIREAHLRGLYVIAWTVNDPLRMEELIRWGVDTVMTDKPDVVKSIIEGKGYSRGA